MTNEELDTIWKIKAMNCSVELQTMGFSVWQHDGDTYQWIIRHKKANGATPETTLSHKELVKFTENQRKEYKFYCIACRQTGSVHCSDPIDDCEKK